MGSGRKTTLVTAIASIIIIGILSLGRFGRATAHAGTRSRPSVR